MPMARSTAAIHRLSCTNSNGRQLSSLFEIDFNGDGMIDRRYSSQSTYDANGNTLSALSESDNNGDGVLDYRQLIQLIYDANGNLLSHLSEIDNGEWHDRLSHLPLKTPTTPTATGSVTCTKATTAQRHDRPSHLVPIHLRRQPQPAQ